MEPQTNGKLLTVRSSSQKSKRNFEEILSFEGFNLGLYRFDIIRQSRGQVNACKCELTSMTGACSPTFALNS